MAQMTLQCWSTATFNEAILEKKHTATTYYLSGRLPWKNKKQQDFCWSHFIFGTSVCRLSLRMMVPLAMLFAGPCAIAFPDMFFSQSHWNLQVEQGHGRGWLTAPYICHETSSCHLQVRTSSKAVLVFRDCMNSSILRWGGVAGR